MNKCENCQKETTKKRFCCFDCYNEWRKKQLPIVECKTCKKEFHAFPYDVLRGKAIYCSPVCQGVGKQSRASVTCKICGKLFIVNEFKATNQGAAYCSIDCKAKAQRKGEYRNCRTCKKEFYAPLSDTKNGGGIYCSKLCELESKEWYTRQSKPEKEFCEILTREGIEHDTHRQCRKYRIDIAIPEISLAVEIDGFYHSLPKRQEHDKKRDSHLLEDGWNTYRIQADDVRNIKHISHIRTLLESKV